MRLIEISAWNDSGGSFLNRLLDGHPALNVWPYELLLGNEGANADLFDDNWFRGRFRWPRLGTVAIRSGEDLFDAIADSELKSVLNKSPSAKHSEFPVDVNLETWRLRVGEAWKKCDDKTQAVFLEIYITKFLELWRGHSLIENAKILGHCPIAILDALELWQDFPDAKIIHVVRGPEAGFHDMRRRHGGLDVARYALKWNLVNGFAAILAAKEPDRVRILTLADLLTRRNEVLASLCDWLDIEFSEVVLRPSWNGKEIDTASMGPFGGVPHAFKEVEERLPDKISGGERDVLNRLCSGTRAILMTAHAISI